MIKKISIKNFRSIDYAQINCGHITTFVGKNDAGKSNIIRALNLFFNNNTDYATSYDFDRDFNIFAKIPAKTAKEIQIELVIELPVSYRWKNLPNQVVWRKVWRSTGFHREGEIRRFIDKQKFPPRSKISSLLDRITFNYVPAIKDQHYFSDLQGQLYDVIASVAEEMLRKSASQFEVQIQEHLKELLQQVNHIFDVQSVMKMPRNLRQIFENLEFDVEGIPLSRRGDGIKIRHIPMMLKYLAEKRNSIHNKGICPHIWGFEEPENNIELSASFDMAKQFGEIALDGYQLFLTTHSPVFYSIDKFISGEILPESYYVQKIDKLSSVVSVDKNVIDDEMGLLPIVAPFVADEKIKWQKRISEIKKESEKVIAVANKEIPCVFVEGETDKRIIELAIKLFEPEKVNLIEIYCGQSGEYGSADAVANRSKAWQLIQQHRESPTKAVALFDHDISGDKAKKSLDDEISKLGNKHVKSFQLKADSAIGKLLSKGYLLPVELETLYSNEVWEYAERKGWLEDVLDPPLNEALKASLIMSLIQGETTDPFSGLTTEENRMLKKQFTDDGKVAVSKYIVKADETNSRLYIARLEKIIKEILAYLL